MDDSAQGIVDKPISADEMAAIDQAASQYGAVVQPTSNMVMPTVMPTSDDSNDTQTADATNQPIDESSPVSSYVPGVIQPPAGSEPEVVAVDPIADETPAPFVDEPVDEGTPSETVGEEQVANPDNTNDDTPQPVADEDPMEGITPLIDAPEQPEEDQTETEDEQSQEDSSVPVETGSGTDEELFEVKQHALEELTPIVDTLELPAEERFDTLMMIIRASDDKKLIKPAYEAANQIADKDKKARALLDVVNEVNYLTQANPDQ